MTISPWIWPRHLLRTQIWHLRATTHVREYSLIPNIYLNMSPKSPTNLNFVPDLNYLPWICQRCEITNAFDSNLYENALDVNYTYLSEYVLDVEYLPEYASDASPNYLNMLLTSAPYHSEYVLKPIGFMSTPLMVTILSREPRPLSPTRQAEEKRQAGHRPMEGGGTALIRSGRVKADSGCRQSKKTFLPLKQHIWEKHPPFYLFVLYNSPWACDPGCSQDNTCI